MRVCVLGGELERSRRRDGERYRYRWRGREERIFLALNALISV